MKKRTMYLSIFCLLIYLCGCGQSQSHPTSPNIELPETQLSDTCDYILCRGTDTSGNTYELVASQEETALGYEITVGIIKNNTWFVPMSSDSPFLGSDGLFPVEDGKDLGYVARAKLVASHFYFIDSGAFLLKYSELNRGDIHIIFDCNSKQTYTYAEYVDDYKWLYRYYELKTNGSVEDYYVVSYGEILTDNNLILMYKDVSEPFEWNKPKKYDWLILDTKTMKIRTIASNVIDNSPKCSLSEGLFFADDNCFYNINAEKVIDLSMYIIDTWEDGGLYFKNGTCTFIAKNDLGSKFEITIDTSGRVLSEIKQ